MGSCINYTVAKRGIKSEVFCTFCVWSDLPKPFNVYPKIKVILSLKVLNTIVRILSGVN